MRIQIPAVCAFVILFGALVGCTPAAVDPPPVLIELEQDARKDVRAASLCEESISGEGELLAAGDSDAESIRALYAQGRIIEPSSVDLLPPDLDTYAALCVYDSATSAAGSQIDRIAFWICFDDAGRGGITLFAAWGSGASD